jgi:hypothetical protein
MMLCCICNDEILVEVNGWDKGHNADPVVPEGRCCESCNFKHVIASRMTPEYMSSGNTERTKSARKDDEERKQAARDGITVDNVSMGSSEYIGDKLRAMIRQLEDEQGITMTEEEMLDMMDTSSSMRKAKKERRNKKTASSHRFKKKKRKTFNSKWRDKNR